MSDKLAGLGQDSGFLLAAKVFFRNCFIYFESLIISGVTTRRIQHNSKYFFSLLLQGGWVGSILRQLAPKTRHLRCSFTKFRENLEKLYSIDAIKAYFLIFSKTYSGNLLVAMKVPLGVGDEIVAPSRALGLMARIDL